MNIKCRSIRSNRRRWKSSRTILKVW